MSYVRVEEPDLREMAAWEVLQILHKFCYKNRATFLFLKIRRIKYSKITIIDVIVGANFHTDDMYDVAEKSKIKRNNMDVSLLLVKNY